MKKVFLLMIGLSMAMLAWGCGAKNGSDSDTSATPTPTVEADDTTVQAPVKDKYEVSDYITLGEYKGITATYTKSEVTDADVDTAIQSDLESYATDEEVTDRAVQDGDIVNIDYEGLKDGVAFEGGTAQGWDLTIGSGQFIKGFEEGLIGKNIGDKVVLDLTFPEDYQTNGQPSELAGQAAVFNVTINTIKVSKTPELTDDFVKENTDYETVDAYKEGKRTELEASNQESMENEKISNLMKAIVDNSTISSYPQTLIDYYEFEFESRFSQYAQAYGMELADFISAYGYTEETYAEQKKTYAEGGAAQDLVINAIVKAEKLDLTEEEYKAGLADYLTQYGVTEEEFLKNVSEDQVRESLTWNKVIDYIVDNSVEA